MPIIKWEGGEGGGREGSVTLAIRTVVASFPESFSFFAMLKKIGKASV